jgi:hypothetical protein
MQQILGMFQNTATKAIMTKIPGVSLDKAQINWPFVSASGEAA